MNIKEEMVKGLGLVFAGGGGKGAYEIGVWKYLHEIGLDRYVRAVSGTSVGALNAALFVGSSYEVAENLWLNISQDKILTPKKISADDIMKWLVANGYSKAEQLLMGVSKVAAGAIMEMDKIIHILLTKARKDYMFTRDGIVDMISDGLSFNKLQTSEIPCYVTCVRCSRMETERFKLNEFSDEDITTLLLASSAIPIFFPSEEFQGKIYCDGGFLSDLGVGDNVPVKPVYYTGVENIIVVHLNQKSVIDRTQFPHANIMEIIPREDLGNAMTGTLDFSPEGASYRLQLGYEDAKRIMKPMVDMNIMATTNQRILMMAQQKNIEFEEKRQELLRKGAEIKDKMVNDRFDSIFDELTKEK